MIEQFTTCATFPTLFFACQPDIAFRANLRVDRDDGLTRTARGHLRFVVGHGDSPLRVIKERYNHSWGRAPKK